MATKSIGYVADLVGDAQVRGVDGVIRILAIGDKINEGDVLTTGVGTDIVLELYNGQKLQLGENTEILLDESVFAALNPYPDARADQLAELQSLIVEGIDLAELEATAAGPAGESGDALHQASIYTRDGNEGIVETRGTPLGFDASAANDQTSSGDDGLLAGAQADDDGSSTVGSPVPGPIPAATISVDDITADDFINAAESAATINVTGSVGGDASSGDTVSIDINGNSYSGTVGAGNSFSISVPGADLVADTTLVASVSGIDASGDPFTVTVTSSHSVDTVASATISVDPITADDIVNAAEAGQLQRHRRRRQ
jgi:hypothetical protein